jgi:predicted alpha/beta-hydrolase family hydrolase
LLEIETPHGPARVLLQQAPQPSGALVLGHGAGGGVSAPDLMVATRAAQEAQWSVALVEQPYRVAGRKSQPAASQLDTSWLAVIERLGETDLAGMPVITGGRSAGARVACRTAAATGAVGVICLAYPVHPPGKPEKSREDELDSVEVPVLVVQGDSDPFGHPSKGANRTVVTVPGNHSLKAGLDQVESAVHDWLVDFAVPR